jgi:hypothetical protein
MRERDAPRGAHHELHAKALFQSIEPAPNDRSRHALGLRSGGEAAFSGHGDEGFDLFEFVHAAL